MTTHAYIRGVKTQGWSPLDGKARQCRAYEHIIRHARSHQQIADYITTNPWWWEPDAFDWL